MPTFNNGESGASVRSKINAAIQEVDNVSGDIVGTTGTQTLTNKTLTSPDINGGSVDGVTLGTNSAVTEAQVDNINIDGNTISSTDTNGDINLEPDGTGGVVTTKTITAAQYDSTEALPDIKPSLNLDFANVKRLDPRITYTRASTGTYYDGKTFAKAEENLVLQSQDFTTSWGNTGTTVSGNAETAPDGTSTADEVVEDSSTGEHFVNSLINVSSGITYTVSIFAKLGTGSRLLGFKGFGQGADFPRFDLSAGTVQNTGTNWSNVTITSVGNSWYRCSATVTAVGAFAPIFSLIDSTTPTTANYTGDGSSSIILWGAQLEQRSALTDYVATTTQPITNYIPALQTAASGVARFDHDPITSESLGFLIEEQRTNLLNYSEDFSNASWTKTRSSITSNIVIAPDGTLTGDKLVEDTTASNSHFTKQAESVTAQSYAVSVFAKAAERTQLVVQLGDTMWSDSVRFDLSAGTATTQAGTPLSASIIPVGNGWYKCSFSKTASSSGTAAIRLFLASSGNISYTGDGYSGVYIWGAQLEADSFPTSYIKTTSAQATRNADAASMTGTNFSEWYNAGEGVLFVDAALTVSGFNTIASIDDGTGTDNFIQLDVNILSPRTVIWSNGVSQAVVIIGSGITQGAFNKYAVAYKFNDIAGTISGGSVVTDSSAIIPNVSQLTIGQRSDVTTTKEKLHLRKLAYYPQRLSNSTIQALTEE